MRVTPYLSFRTECRQAFELYASVLGGKVDLFTFGGSPAAEHVGPDMQDLVMHATLDMGDALIMGSDSPAEMYQRPQGTHVSLHPTDPAEAERIYAALSEGGQITMPLQETFWAARFGMFTDRFGTPWMINCDRQG